ncbi:MAG: hypothetical protein WCI89_03275 [bacterium]
MNPQVQSSFIPKKPLTGLGAHTSSSAFGSIFLLIAILLLAASLVSAGAAFAYERYLISSIAGNSASLDKAQAAFDPATIQELVRMDSRLTNAQALLQKHVAASALFGFLASQTLQRVSFSNFSYALGDDGSVSVTLAGEADSFSTLALQSDQLSANKLLKDVLFSGVAVGQSGQVTFSVRANVDPGVIKYSNTL